MPGTPVIMRFFLRLLCLVGGFVVLGLAVVLLVARPRHAYWLSYIQYDVRAEIVRANPDGSDPAVIAPGRAIVWAPDGRSLVFRAGVFGSPDLYYVGWDGRGMRQLTDTAALDLNPVWSPDGSALVWAAESRRAWRIGRMTPGIPGSPPEWLTGDGALDESAESPAWSPDGRWIAFVRGAAYGSRDIVLMQPDGRGLRAVVRGEAPLWSPDGRWLVYTCGTLRNNWCRLPVVDGEPQPDDAQPWLDDAFDLA